MESMGRSIKSTGGDPVRERIGTIAGKGVSLKPIGDPAFLRLHCSMCHNRFVLDLEADWGSPPLDMEVEGRTFLGIEADAVLCHLCLHSVQVAGAERMYWRLAHY